MNYKKIINIVLLTLVPVIASAGDMISAQGKISAMRTSSQYHESIPPEVEAETIFKLDSGLGDCAWVGVKNSENTFVSMLLSAHAQSKEVKVWFYRDKFSSLWGNVCQAITIEVK